MSIGTSVPLLTPFKNNLISIGQSLLVIAIETEKTVERFSYNKSRLNNIGQYYRFNMLRGLEDIGLKNLKQKNAIITATDQYIKSQVVFKQIKAYVNSMSKKNISVLFSLLRHSLQSIANQAPSQIQEIIKYYLAYKVCLQ